MRNTLIALLLALALALPAKAQTALAIHQTAPANAPNKAAASAIIPGSPLAALTGAAPADADADTPAPFGTQGMGFSMSNAIANGAAKSLGDFTPPSRNPPGWGPPPSGWKVSGRMRRDGRI